MARGRGGQRGEGDETGQAGRAQGSSSQQNTQGTLHPLLTLQEQHRLKLLIDGQPVPNLMIRHGFRTVAWDPRYEPYVRQAGFLGLHQIGRVRWDDALIRAFVERWRPETHTFHLPVGEMTITLEDVSVLLGLPIHGTPVCGITDMNWEDVVRNNLGVFPAGKAMANKSAISLRWLKENFDRLDYNASEQQVERFARAYMLSLLGTVLFVDLTGDSIPAIYLPFLTNFNETRSYAWGAAVLARVYRQLCHGSKKESKQMGGCVLLILLWIWERFPNFQPKELNRIVLSGLNPETVPPRGFYWSSQHSWVDNKRSLQTYRVLIDALQDGDVKWMPYDEGIMNGLPPVCRLHENYWLSTAALMDFAIVETYHPDRVYRQFGKLQTIPPPARSTLQHLHSVDRQKQNKQDWRAYHRDFYEEWLLRREATILTENRPYDPNTLAAYLEWYNAATIPTFQGAGGLCTDGVPVRERLHRPEINLKNLVKKVINFAKKAARKMRTKSDKISATEAFKLCREVVGTIDDIRNFDRELEKVGDEEIEEEDEEGEEGGDEEGEEGGDEDEEDEEEAAEEDEEEAAEEEAEGVVEEERADDEIVQEDDDESWWNTTISQVRSQVIAQPEETQARSQVTQEPEPSRRKRPRRAGAKYK